MTDLELRQALSQYFKRDISIDALTESYDIRAALAHTEVDNDEVLRLTQGIVSSFADKHGAHIIHALLASFTLLMSDFCDTFMGEDKDEAERAIIFQALMLVVATGLIRSEAAVKT